MISYNCDLLLPDLSNERVRSTASYFKFWEIPDIRVDQRPKRFAHDELVYDIKFPNQSQERPGATVAPGDEVKPYLLIMANFPFATWSPSGEYATTMYIPEATRSPFWFLPSQYPTRPPGV